MSRSRAHPQGRPKHRREPLYFGTMHHGTTIPDLISEFGWSGTRPPIKVHSLPWPKWWGWSAAAASDAAPIHLSFAIAKRNSPCNRGSVFRSNLRLLQVSLLASCWGLQVSPSIQRQPKRSCTAHTRVIPGGALPARASCSGLVRWRVLRSVTMPVAT